ncbi:MAG: copper chaperone PCu(A)C, partial [Thioalkalivibrio sp.]|nr:copper chaperone PCu(A)C [Thioalkalivibrio sp.]
IRPAGSDEPSAPPVNSAGYLMLRNTGSAADALVSVETEVADTAELHSVSLDGGIMRMRAVDSIPVPAGGEVVLEPGGYHIMLIGLRSALAEGDSVAMVLRLRSGAEVELVAPVRRAGM